VFFSQNIAGAFVIVWILFIVLSVIYCIASNRTKNILTVNGLAGNKKDNSLTLRSLGSKKPNKNGSTFSDLSDYYDELNGRTSSSKGSPVEKDESSTVNDSASVVTDGTRDTNVTTTSKLSNDMFGVFRSNKNGSKSHNRNGSDAGSVASESTTTGSAHYGAVGNGKKKSRQLNLVQFRQKNEGGTLTTDADRANFMADFYRPEAQQNSGQYSENEDSDSVLVNLHDLHD